MTHNTQKLTPSEILENLAQIKERIHAACRASGRGPEEVRLMLVTKTVPAETISLVLGTGENLIGENLIEELAEKYDHIRSDNQPEIHFIGNLRKCDLDKVIRYADCIQTVDHFMQAEELNRRLVELDETIDILIQVNTSWRDRPFGTSPAHVIGLAMQIARLSHIRIRGLMTLGEFDTSPEIARACFRLLRNLYDEIRALEIPNVRMDILSMGMSDHLEVAVEEGSTMVRIGTSIFGERDTPDSFYWKE